MKSDQTGKRRTSLLRKWQRNDIFQAIQAAGIDPTEFDLQDDGVEVRIKHQWTDSCFTIGGGPGHYVGRWIVGDGPDWPFDAYSWTAMPTRMRDWLAQVKPDLETPDLWAELQRGVGLLGANFEDLTENAPFTLDEQRVIAERLQELAEGMRRTYSLSETQMWVLKAKLDYLVEAAGRLGRIDWRNAFAGAILGFILTAAISPDAGRAMILGNSGSRSVLRASGATQWLGAASKRLPPGGWRDIAILNAS